MLHCLAENEGEDLVVIHDDIQDPLSCLSIHSKGCHSNLNACTQSHDDQIINTQIYSECSARTVSRSSCIILCLLGTPRVKLLIIIISLYI